jgi:hypothetical protein
VKDRRQLELELPGDRRREFVVSVDTAHVRSADPKSGRNFELVVARCGRGGRGEAGGGYFVTASTDQHCVTRSRTPCSWARRVSRLWRRRRDLGWRLKRLPRAMPRPTARIIDWFHNAMKIQPMHQIVDHMARFRRDEPETSPSIARRIRAVKWGLWHGASTARSGTFRNC